VTVTFEEPLRLARNCWRLQWTSTEATPSYRVYVDGALVQSGARDWIDIPVGVGDTPVVEVFDDESTPTEGAFPGWLLLFWQSASGVESYRIEEYSGGDWVARRTLLADGRLYYRYRTAVLADDTTHQWRVVPVQGGNDGTPLSFSALVVRHPDAPTASYSYDAGTGLVTVTVS
jgi:hypothetical protein